MEVGETNMYTAIALKGGMKGGFCLPHPKILCPPEKPSLPSLTSFFFFK